MTQYSDSGVEYALLIIIKKSKVFKFQSFLLKTQFNLIRPYLIWYKIYLSSAII